MKHFNEEIEIINGLIKDWLDIIKTNPINFMKESDLRVFIRLFLWVYMLFGIPFIMIPLFSFCVAFVYIMRLLEYFLDKFISYIHCPQFIKSFFHKIFFKN